MIAFLIPGMAMLAGIQCCDSISGAVGALGTDNGQLVTTEAVDRLRLSGLPVLP